MTKKNTLYICPKGCVVKNSERLCYHRVMECPKHSIKYTEMASLCEECGKMHRYKNKPGKKLAYRKFCPKCVAKKYEQHKEKMREYLRISMQRKKQGKERKKPIQKKKYARGIYCTHLKECMGPGIDCRNCQKFEPIFKNVDPLKLLAVRFAA